MQSFVSLDTLIDRYGKKYIRPYGNVIQMPLHDYEFYKYKIDPKTKVVVLERRRAEIPYVWIILPESIHIPDLTKGTNPPDLPHIIPSAHQQKFMIVSPKNKQISVTPQKMTVEEPVKVSVGNVGFPIKSKVVFRGLDNNLRFRKMVINFLYQRGYIQKEVKSSVENEPNELVEYEYVIQTERGTVITTDRALVEKYLGMTQELPLEKLPQIEEKSAPQKPTNIKKSTGTYGESATSYTINYGTTTTQVSKPYVEKVSEFLKTQEKPVTTPQVCTALNLKPTTCKRSLQILVNYLKTVSMSREADKQVYYQIKK